MTIRKVVLWYLVALVVVGTAGATGFQALRQHRAQVAARQVPAPQAVAPQAVAAQTPLPGPAPESPAPVLARPVVPPVKHVAAASPLLGPLPPLPRPPVGARTVHKARPGTALASAHRAGSAAATRSGRAVYAAAPPPSGPPAPVVAYYAYPGYYVYAPAVRPYGYYPWQPYYGSY